MPHEMTWNDRNVYKRFWGFVTAKEYGNTQETVLNDPRVDELRYVINDFLAVEGFEVTQEQAEYMAAYNRGPSFTNPRVRIAYVTTDPRIIHLMKQMAGLSSYQMKAFATIEEAAGWGEEGI